MQSMVTANLLQNKRGIISGVLDENSIAWQIALKASKAGAQLVLTNAPVAIRMGKTKQLAEQLNTECIVADASKEGDIENLFSSSRDILGGKIDFVLHSIGMSPNVRKKKAYTDLNYDFYAKTLDISAGSFHKMLQVAYQGDHMNDWGSFVALSYIAAQRCFPNYNDMADAKALLESITRSFGFFFGKRNKVRVNTISQSPTPTTAGTGVKGFDTFFNYAEKMSPLGNATAEDCANYCLFLFSDLSRKITMQNLFSDGGFSSMGIAPELLEEGQ